ncbi:MAG TPA: replicative DNA helicase, partial [Deinococcales bacterium]|nr:replicative DNA helicase [Deinococcales bacterium]
PLEEILDQAEAGIFQVSTARKRHSFQTMSGLVQETFSYIDEMHQNPDPVSGLRTGFKDLDELTAGLQPSSLNVLAARPSMGKTAAALTIGQHAALREDKAVAVFSLEMSAVQLVTRMLCSEARVDMSRVRNGQLSDRDFQRMADTANRMSEARIFIDDNGMLSVTELRSRARRLKSEHDLGLVVIDYLQLMTGGNTENRQQEISSISRGLKSLARELDIPVLVLSQLSRAVESRPNKRPMLSDLRESGAIEQDADLVMFIYRDEYYDPHTEQQGIAEIIVGKQRNGPVGTVKLQFHGSYVKFHDLAQGYDS